MIYILTGKKHSGKTTFLKGLINNLEAKGLKFYGILSEAAVENGINAGYDAFDLERKATFPLSRKYGKKGWQRARIYYLIPEAIKKVSRIITARRPQGYILVIDEIGPLEVREKKGIWGAAAEALMRAQNDIIVVIKEEVAREFGLLLKGRDDLKLCKLDAWQKYLDFE